MSTSTPGSTTPPDTWWSRYTDRFGEGFLVVVFMAAYVAVVAFAVQFGEWENLYVPAGIVGTLSAVSGVILAKSRLSDAIAHLVSLILGAVVVGMFVLDEAESFGERLIDRVKPFAIFVADWYLGRQQSRDEQFLLISFLLGLLVWLIAFLATWSLFRRGWVEVALLLPAILAVINLRYAPVTYPWTIGLMLALAIPMIARMHFHERERKWARRRMASPIGLGGKFVTVGAIVGLLVTLFTAQTPQAWSYPTFQPLIEAAGERYDAASNQAAQWFDQTRGENARDIQDAGSYTAFDDAFSIGGPLNLTDQPEVLVQTNAEQAPYLTARTYDFYTGRGWASTTDELFGGDESNSGRLAPELLFRGGQQVVVTGDVAGARVPQTTTITPLSGPPGVVLSVDTYLTADISTVVRMSWRMLADEPFAITAEMLNSLPPDLQRLGSILLQAELSGAPSDWGPEATSPSMQQEIEEEVDVLAGRGILVRWDATGDGIIQNVFVTGRLPVFDDVEAVFPRNAADAAEGSTYEIRSLSSVATADQLASAPTSYPSWVTERYLQTGETFTDRTRQMAMTVAGDASDPYTQAVLIEEFLRSHITYDERVEAPPAGADLVDYVLFEDRRGYCEQYSAAMTVMMRSLGVPARTVVGYYPGDYDEAEGGFVYRQYNAHAWTEVFFPGYGWVPFEPTANRPLDDRDVTLVPEETELAVPTEAIPTPDTTDPNTASTPVPQNPTLENPGPPEQVVMPDQDGDGLPGWVLPVAASVVLAGVLVGGLWFAWNWRFRGLSPTEALYAKAQRVGALGGVKNGPTTTPREYASQFSRQMPSMGGPVRRIVQVYETDTYGPEGADAGSLVAARAAWNDLRRMAMRTIVRIRRKRGGGPAPKD